jgi:hypothetical protein
MKILKAEIIVRIKSKWYIGTLEDFNFIEEKKIKKLSDIDNYKKYINLSVFSKKIQINENYIKKVSEKYKFDSIYILPSSLKVSSNTYNEYFWKEINKKCLSCTKDCKQSSKIQIIRCPSYERKL